MKNVIHIFGASGSGTTTLGKKICDELGYTLIDTDEYFWLPTDPPFLHKRPREERLEQMKNAILASQNAVVSGSLTDWGDELLPFYTLAVRIEMEQSLRMERLQKREKERFGARIEIGGDMYEQHLAFVEWARAYDDGGMNIRSKALHDALQKTFPCTVLCLDGANTVETNFEQVRSVLNAGKAEGVEGGSVN